MVGFSFRGFGWLAVPVWVLCTGAGAGIVVNLTGAGSRRPAGIGVLGAMVGMAVAAGLVFLLGCALNRRRDTDGQWHWTDRHELIDVPVQDLWGYFLAGVLLIAPFVGIGFIPARVVEGMFCGWAVLFAVGVFVVAALDDWPKWPRRSATTASGKRARSGRRRWDAVIARRRLPAGRPASSTQPAEPAASPAPTIIEGSLADRHHPQP